MNIKTVSILLSILFLFGCQTSDLSVKLNRASYTNDSTYGYSINNPICIKYKNLNSESLIRAYVHNLNKGEIVDSKPYLQTLMNWNVVSIVETIENNPGRKSLAKKTTIQECLIQSDDKKFNTKLYFNTNKNKPLKIPVGFSYARLCGVK